MTYVCSRRQWLISLIPAVACSRWVLARAGQKPMRGVFVIMATPYTSAKEVDYEDLAREVDFLDRCKVHGMVWPQLASEYSRLTKEERLQGMKILARAAAGKKPALVLGVQGRNTAEALEYLQCAEEASPDAVIAIPPTEAKSLDDFREYYTTLARKTKLPFFVQTTGGAPNIEPTVEFLVELAREFPHCGYVKEEFNPVIDRMKALAAHRPTIKGVFSGQAGRGMMYEMRLGFDGTMPGAPYAELYSQIWNSYQSGQEEKARELFGRLLLMINLEQQIPGTRQYVMHKRGVFKTTISRQREFHWTAEAKKEIDSTWVALKPYLID